MRKETLYFRGYIRPDIHPLTYSWSQNGRRFFPKSLVSNAESMLRFIAMGLNPQAEHAYKRINELSKVSFNDNGYLVAVVVDPHQHVFLYNVLSNINDPDAMLNEICRIHDMWVLVFGLTLYTDSPLKQLQASSAINTVSMHKVKLEPAESKLSRSQRNKKTSEHNDTEIGENVNRSRNHDLQSPPLESTQQGEPKNDGSDHPEKSDEDKTKKVSNSGAKVKTQSRGLLDKHIKK